MQLLQLKKTDSTSGYKSTLESITSLTNFMHSGFQNLAYMLPSAIDILVNHPTKFSYLDPLKFYRANCIQF